MTALAVLRALTRAGVAVIIRGDRIRYRAPAGSLTPELRAEIQASREDLIALLERYEERAAILEFDAGLDREEAERRAWVAFSRQHAADAGGAGS